MPQNDLEAKPKKIGFHHLVAAVNEPLLLFFPSQRNATICQKKTENCSEKQKITFLSLSLRNKYFDEMSRGSF